MSKPAPPSPPNGGGGAGSVPKGRAVLSSVRKTPRGRTPGASESKPKGVVDEAKSKLFGGRRSGSSSPNETDDWHLHGFRGNRSRSSSPSAPPKSKYVTSPPLPDRSKPPMPYGAPLALPPQSPEVQASLRRRSTGGKSAGSTSRSAPGGGQDGKARKVYIIYTGGTIGMVRSDEGLKPAAAEMMQVLRSLSDFSHRALPTYHVHQYDPLIDSSDMTTGDWKRIAEDIYEHYDEYDGFVVLHGTDTMAYTGSALSFMLEQLSKPVILTGSQIPLFALRNDARDNLLVSMILAAYSEIPEVCLFFDSKLLRGNRARKANAWDLAAFDSPNCPALGQVGIDINVNNNMILEPPTGKFQVFSEMEANVISLRLFPGIADALLENVLAPPLKGCVLETFGTGNAPQFKSALLKTLKAAADRGVVVVALTQCRVGSVALDRYATGAALRRMGVVSAYDMTPEAALTKLMYLLGKGLNADEVRKEFERPLVGELTPGGLMRVVGSDGLLWLYDDPAELQSYIGAS